MSFVLFDISLRLFMAFAAFFGATWVLRYYDKTSGRPFRESFETMKGDPRALATYYGARIIGVCILIAIILA